ncbi:MAG: tetratricopeptide repeat protein [Deltaproteobacteria bacterium]|jgi:Tfp pilus assembly protein PilF|nr:MAG: tetratricopeptide repeat protein [Deltaproteobacteria bacterium]
MKRMLTIVTVIIGLALSHYVAFADMPPPKDKNENPNIAAARKSIEAKDFKAAVGQLTKAVQEEPKNADAHSMLGYSYRKLGTFDKSMEHYQTALKIDSGHRSAHEYLGELYLDMDQPDNAEKQLAALKKACPFFGKCEEYEDLKKAVDSYKAKKK